MAMRTWPPLPPRTCWLASTIRGRKLMTCKSPRKLPKSREASLDQLRSKKETRRLLANPKTRKPRSAHLATASTSHQWADCSNGWPKMRRKCRRIRKRWPSLQIRPARQRIRRQLSLLSTEPNPKLRTIMSRRQSKRSNLPKSIISSASRLNRCFGHSFTSSIGRISDYWTRILSKAKS